MCQNLVKISFYWLGRFVDTTPRLTYKTSWLNISKLLLTCVCKCRTTRTSTWQCSRVRDQNQYNPDDSDSDSIWNTAQLGAPIKASRHRKPIITKKFRNRFPIYSSSRARTGFSFNRKALGASRVICDRDPSARALSRANTDLGPSLECAVRAILNTHCS